LTNTPPLTPNIIQHNSFNATGKQVKTAHLLHLEPCFYVQQVALSARVQQEGIAAEAERPITAVPSAGLVLRLAPCGVVVLHIHLLTAGQESAKGAVRK
jgi:hypothetical protein